MCIALSVLQATPTALVSCEMPPGNGGYVSPLPMLPPPSSSCALRSKRRTPVVSFVAGEPGHFFAEALLTEEMAELSSRGIAPFFPSRRVDAHRTLISLSPSPYMSSTTDNLPACLRWPSDPESREDMVRDLPQQLFPQLQRCLEPLNAPPPGVLWAAWHLRPRALMSLAIMEVTDETMTSWIHAYEIAWQMRDDWTDPSSPRTTDAENLVRRPYIHACANLLLGHIGQASRATVPISTVNGLRNGRIQFLCLDKCAGAMALHPHPQFAWQGGQFSATFLAGLAARVALGRRRCASPSQIF